MNSKESRPAHVTGGCLCGAVRYDLHGPLRDVWNCHCGQCRRTHGHIAAYTAAARSGLTLVEDRGLAWYDSSETARRGFCRNCGASLFWETRSGDSISVAAGTLDPPTKLRTSRHIFVDHKSDYYDIADDLEQVAGSAGP